MMDDNPRFVTDGGINTHNHADECEWGDCTNEAVTTRPGFNRPIDVCDDHREDPNPEGY